MLAHFPAGWEPAIIHPGASAWESMPLQPLGEEPHGTCVYSIHCGYSRVCVSVCKTNLRDITYTPNPPSP